MLTIGQLARLGETTVRAIRHYHQTGLLPEPPRRDNGYRQYRASDLDRLIRIRQLSNLGLSLPDVRRLMLAAPNDRREALRTLDDQYAAQQELLASRRARLAALLSAPGDPVSPDAYRGSAATLRDLGAPERVIDLEEAMLRTIRSLVPATDRPALDDALTDLTVDPETARLIADFMRRLDGIADLPLDDQEVTDLIEDYTAFIRATWPDIVTADDVGPDDPLATWTVEDLMAEHLSPTQTSAIKCMMANVRPQTGAAASGLPDG